MPEPIRRVADTHERPQGLLDQKLARGGFPFEPGDVARLRANYAGNVTLIDDQISEILKVVEQRGDLERTVIAFVSDHGEMNGDHQLLYKQNFLDPAARVPLVLRLPRTMAAPSGAISNAMVELMDVGATLVEIAGGDPVEGSRARSLLPIMKDPSRSHREVVLSELRQEAMVASASWKLAVNQRSEIYILYDLEADARERHNLAGLSEYSAVAADLYECLRQRADEGGRAPGRESPKRQPSKNAIREKLRPRRRDARR
jgi:choline-sulfatase